MKVAAVPGTPGIFDAHDQAILTSASLMANAPATADAIRRVRIRPSLGVGVHLTLVDGVPMLPPSRVPTLVNDDGRFHPSWRPFIVACLTGRVALDEVQRELTAQIDRVRSEGIRVTHLDDGPPRATWTTRCAGCRRASRDRASGRSSCFSPRPPRWCCGPRASGWPGTTGFQWIGPSEGVFPMRPRASRPALDLSIVVPLFKESGTLEKLHRRLTRVISCSSGSTWTVGTGASTRSRASSDSGLEPRGRAR